MQLKKVLKIIRTIDNECQALGPALGPAAASAWVFTAQAAMRSYPVQSAST